MRSRRAAHGLVFAVAATVVLMMGATPAGAHAVLLRTEPSPQSTVGAAPSTIRLFFSESVESVFGGIRVFDVDGRRVDAGGPRHPDGDRATLELPVGHLADGTYTVTWRVVSADAHAVRGGFVFYVGAPSTISAVAIAGEAGAGALATWGAGAVRLVGFVAFCALLGLAVGRRFVWTPATVAAGAEEAATVFRRRFRRLLPIAWSLLAASVVLSLGFEAAKVSGLPLGRAFAPDALGEMLGTTFGRLWLAEAVLVAAMAAPVAVLARRQAPPLLRPDGWLAVGGALAGAVAVVIALNGHARTDSIPPLAVASVAVHLVTVAVWVGGLLGLILAGITAFGAVAAERRSALLAEVLRRFSPIAIGSVVVIVLTGTLTSLFGFDSVSDLWRIAYGRVVLAKVVLLAAALAIATRHLFVLPKRAAGAIDDRPVRSFRRSSAVEAAVLVVVLSLAAALVDLVPGRSLALAAGGAASLERTVDGETVQVFMDPTAIGLNELHVTFVDPSGLAAADVLNLSATLTVPGRTPADLAMRLLSPGHFVGDVEAPVAGRYRLRVATTAGIRPLETTFSITIKEQR